MTRTSKYVALDVHQATTVASIRAETGQVIARTILPTEAPALVEFFRGMRGAVHVAFEEGTQAQWLHDLLVPLVHQVVVCDRHGESGAATKAIKSMPTSSRRDSGGAGCGWSITTARTAPR
jgi:hypothetical protein